MYKYTCPLHAKNPLLPNLFSSSERVDRNSIVVRLYNRGVPSSSQSCTFHSYNMSKKSCPSQFTMIIILELRTCEEKQVLKCLYLLLLSNKCLEYFYNIQYHEVQYEKFTTVYYALLHKALEICFSIDDFDLQRYDTIVKNP